MFDNKLPTKGDDEKAKRYLEFGLFLSTNRGGAVSDEKK